MYFNFLCPDCLRKEIKNKKEEKKRWGESVKGGGKGEKW